MEKDIATKIASSGGRLFRVGGSVRDALLGKTPKDLDFVVTGLSVERFGDLFPEAKINGKTIFPVFVLAGMEIALARKERKEGVGYHGFTFFSDPSVSIEDDLLRRDLTINAIAVDVLSGEFVDPFGGREDVRNGIFRAVSPAFAEDPTRVYRLARFAAKFNFAVDLKTLEMARALRPELDALAPEKVWAEVEKALLTPRPSRFFEVLCDAGVLDVHFPELHALIGVQQPERWHPEGDALVHTLLVLDKAAALSNRIEVRFAALVHDLGKGVTPRELWPRHFGHEAAGAPLAQALATRLRVPNKVRDAGVSGAALHGKFHRLSEMRGVKVVDLLATADASPLGADGLAMIAAADASSKGLSSAEVDFAPLFKWQQIKGEVNGKTVALPNGAAAKWRLRELRGHAWESLRVQHQNTEKEDAQCH